MVRKTILATAVAGALAAISQGAAAQTFSSRPSYLQGTDGTTTFTSILTTGDSVGGYQMVGIPDGLGAFDNGNGTFTVLMNHEIPSALGTTRAHGAVGAFVSEWVIRKSDLAVMSGQDLIQHVYAWDTTTQTNFTTALSSGPTFQRFCSADLAAVSAYSYSDPTSGITYGTTNRIFLNGEEVGTPANSRTMGHVATGADAGKSYELGKFGLNTNGSGINAYNSWENLLANPVSQLKTVVAANNDGGTGIASNAVAIYVGTKTTTGTDVDKAGLTNGTLKFVNVAGVTSEINNATTRTTGIADGTAFTLSATSSTTFSRPEDGHWSADGKTYYFVTTDQLDTTDLASPTTKGGTRLWALSFSDISNPDAGGTIRKLIDTSANPGGLGVAKPNMFDNITVNPDGTITILEDVGNANHNGKVWIYNPADGSLKMVGKFDPALFGDVNNLGVFTAGTHTRDEETSGVIDITSILGRNDGKQYSLLDAQDHALASFLLANGFISGVPGDAATLVEGGQLLLMTTNPVPEPETYAMMLAGLGALGGLAAMRRRARKA